MRKYEKNEFHLHWQSQNYKLMPSVVIWMLLLLLLLLPCYRHRVPMAAEINKIKR